MSMHTRHNEIEDRIARPCFDRTPYGARQRRMFPEFSRYASRL